MAALSNLPMRLPVADFNAFNFFYFIAKKRNTVTIIHIRKIDIYRIAFYPEGTTVKFNRGTGIQRIHQGMQKALPR